MGRSLYKLIHALAAANRLIDQRDIVRDGGVAGVLGLRLGELCPGPAQIAAQQIRIADVVDDLGARPEDRERLGISAVSQLVAFEAVVRSCEAEPGFAIAGRLLGGASEVLFGEAVVLLPIMPLAEHQVVPWVAPEQFIVHGHRIGAGNDRRAARDVARCGSGAAGEFARSGRGRRGILSPVEAGELELTGGRAARDRHQAGERDERANDTHELTTPAERAGVTRYNGWESNERGSPRAGG